MRIMNDGEAFICPICGKFFYNSRGLYRHLSQSHSNYSFIINSPFLIKMLMKMEKSMEELKNIDKIIYILESIEILLRDIKEQLSSTSIHYSKKNIEREIRGKTPSFLIGNPWIKVLSKRGKKD